MGVFRRRDSPFYWLWLERPGQRGLSESTKIPTAGRTRQQARRHAQDAREAYFARMADLAREGYRLPPRARCAGGVLSFDAFAGWWATNTMPTHRGAEREAEILPRLRARFGTLPLDAVSRQAVEEWITKRRAEVSSRTVNREVDVLKSILRKAVELGHVDQSPLAGMPLLKIVQPQRRLMTPDEEDRILAAISDPADRAIVVMGLDTLCRLGDILDLRREHDHGSRLFIQDPKDPGQSRPYWVPVSKRLRRYLDAVPKTGPFYFAHRRRGKTAHNRGASVRDMLKRACKAAGVPYGRASGGITFHWATRRTGATRMILGGVDPKTVQELGHWASSDIVLEIYTESTKEAQRAAVEVPAQRPPGKRRSA